MRDRSEYLALSAVAFLLRLLPWRFALALGATILDVSWWLGIRRRLVLRNLGAAFPALSIDSRRRLGRRAARNFGRTVTEFLRFAGRDRRRMLERIEIEGLEELRAALAGGAGALVVTGHLGSWALYVTALAKSGIPSALLVGKQRNALVDAMILGIPGEAVRFISKGKYAPRHVLEALNEGRVVVMVADHYASSETVWAPFLGRPASTLPLPGALLERRRLPLFVMTGIRDAANGHRLRIARLSVDPRLDGEALRLEVACRCNAALGEAITETPEQYFWYHDRWKFRSVFLHKKGVLGTPPVSEGQPAAASTSRAH